MIELKGTVSKYKWLKKLE